MSWKVLFVVLVIALRIRNGTEETEGKYETVINDIRCVLNCSLKDVEKTPFSVTEGKTGTEIFRFIKWSSSFLQSVVEIYKRCRKNVNCLVVWGKGVSVLFSGFRDELVDFGKLTGKRNTSVYHERRMGYQTFSERRISNRSAWLKHLIVIKKNLTLSHDLRMKFRLFFGNGYEKRRIPVSKSRNRTSWLELLCKLVILAYVISMFFEKKNVSEALTKSYFSTKTKDMYRLTSVGGLNTRYVAYPVSFGFMNDIEHKKKEDLMNYEWLRLETFKTFSASVDVSAMKLAEAGFYYAGDGEEVVCFSCGLKNSKWNTDETVKQTHKRLSPNCAMVKGTDKTNVPIHEKLTDTDLGSQATSDAACGGPGDDPHDSICNDRKHVDEGSVPNETNGGDIISSPVGHDSSFDSQRCDHQNNDGWHFPERSRDNPKHLEFALRSQRMASFSDWPSSHPISPEQLTEAGFFYTGPFDQVRCFSCGGGLRGWRHGDDPWAVHARWFHDCYYVRHFKGDNFVRQYRTSDGSPELYDQNSRFEGEDSTRRGYVNGRRQQGMNNAAILSALEMGYSNERVQAAITQLRQYQGRATVTAEQLVNHLIENRSLETVNENTPPSTNLPIDDDASTNSDASSDGSPLTNRSKKNLHQDTESKPKDTKDIEDENKEIIEKLQCKICYDREANIVFLPCGHMVSCVTCAHALRKCAVCRRPIAQRIRTYLG